MLARRARGVDAEPRRFALGAAFGHAAARRGRRAIGRRQAVEQRWRTGPPTPVAVRLQLLDTSPQLLDALEQQLVGRTGLLAGLLGYPSSTAGMGSLGAVPAAGTVAAERRTATAIPGLPSRTPGPT